MADLTLNKESWDIELSGQDMAFTSDSEAIQQHLEQRLKTFYQEWFLDRRVGVPYFQQVLVKSPDPIVLDSVFKAVIVNTPGVTELLSFALETNRSTRELRLSFKAAITNDETITFDEVLP